MELCRHRAVVYEQARQRYPRRWSRSVRCWRQPEVVCGVDQPAAAKNRTRASYIVDGYLNSSRRVIFPDSHRGGRLIRIGNAA
jgi:hypothetical protein